MSSLVLVLVADSLDLPAPLVPVRGLGLVVPCVALGGRPRLLVCSSWAMTFTEPPGLDLLGAEGRVFGVGLWASYCYTQLNNNSTQLIKCLGKAHMQFLHGLRRGRMRFTDKSYNVVGWSQESSFRNRIRLILGYLVFIKTSQRAHVRLHIAHIYTALMHLLKGFCIMHTAQDRLVCGPKRAHIRLI